MFSTIKYKIKKNLNEGNLRAVLVSIIYSSPIGVSLHIRVPPNKNTKNIKKKIINKSTIIKFISKNNHGILFRGVK
jgi:hypothetical protein